MANEAVDASGMRSRAVERVGEDTLVDLDIEIAYSGPDGRHTEYRHFPAVNMWRDIFPAGLDRALTGKMSGDRVMLSLGADDLAGPRRSDLQRTIPRRHLDLALHPGRPSHADPGRFLPRGMLHLAGLAGVYRDNVKPFRIVAATDDEVAVDLNHPLAGRGAQLTASVGSIYQKSSDVGGRCLDLVQSMIDGAGMQTRSGGTPTRFMVRDWNSRLDEGPDAEFYSSPRFVAHLDARARATVQGIYARILPREGAVLDLMSSMLSHLPDDRRFARVAGIGMNMAELEANPALSERLVHDLDARPVLAFPDGVFDAVISTVSVEYLTRPVEVFREVGRVLRPGGPFVVTFSNRWFPPKVVKAWAEAHPYERIGLVMEYFLQSGAFEGLETLSVQGHPRPADDPYSGTTALSDPVFAVWGRAVAPRLR